MIDVTWEELEEHIAKGDLAEHIKARRAEDKQRQLYEDLCQAPANVSPACRRMK